MKKFKDVSKCLRRFRFDEIEIRLLYKQKEVYKASRFCFLPRFSTATFKAMFHRTEDALNIIDDPQSQSIDMRSRK